MRDNLRDLITQRIQAQDKDVYGQVASRVRLIPWDTTGVLMPVVDVLVNRAGGTRTITNVPVAANNHAMQYVAIGAPVRMRRSATGRIEVIGMDKRAVGGLIRYTLDIETGQPSNPNAQRYIVRVLTLFELGCLEGTDFGETSMATFGLFDYYTGELIRVLDPEEVEVQQATVTRTPRT